MPIIICSSVPRLVQPLVLIAKEIGDVFVRLADLGGRRKDA